MPIVTILPHVGFCPEGASFEAKTGDFLAQAMNQAGIPLPHACEYNGACATCHVIIEEGYDSLEEPSDAEYDKLDAAFGSGPKSRLACRVRIGMSDLTVRIPMHNRNLV